MENTRYKKYTIPTCGGTLSLNIESLEKTVVLEGSGTLTSSYTVAPYGTAVSGMSLNILYTADMTLDGNNITIFGETLSDNEAVSNIEIRLFYDGIAWQIIKKINSDDITVDASSIVSLNGSVLEYGSVPAASLETTGGCDIFKGDGGGGAETLTVGDAEVVSSDGTNIVSAPIVGDVSAALTGGNLVLTLEDGVVDIENISDIPQGSIIKGGTLNAPEYLDLKTAGYIPIGTGTDIVSVPISKDVIGSYNSNTDEYEVSVKGATGSNNLTLMYSANGISKTYIFEDLVSAGYLDGSSNIIKEFGHDIIVLSVELWKKTATGSGTVDVSAVFGIGGNKLFIDGGDLTVTGLDEWDKNNFGYLEMPYSDTNTQILVESSKDISASGGFFNLVVNVIEL
jgi:hypothetical protein